MFLTSFEELSNAVTVNISSSDNLYFCKASASPLETISTGCIVFKILVIDSIIELPNDISMKLSDGLCGIGWGICYLLRKKFIVGEVDKQLYLVFSKDGEKIGYEAYLE